MVTTFSKIALVYCAKRGGKLVHGFCPVEIDFEHETVKDSAGEVSSFQDLYHSYEEASAAALTTTDTKD